MLMIFFLGPAVSDINAPSYSVRELFGKRMVTFLTYNLTDQVQSQSYDVNFITSLYEGFKSIIDKIYYADNDMEYGW